MKLLDLELPVFTMAALQYGCFVCTVLFATVAWAQNDDTLIPGAKGSDVVEATLTKIDSSCTFPDDKLLMRRISYVESDDGEDPDTYRDGYHGGIWQVDEAFFIATKSNEAMAELLEYIYDIQENFGIDWRSVIWEDLRMPLYSALGARLYIEWTSRFDSSGIPRDIEGQADFWKQYYRTDGDTDYFIEKSEELEDGCTKSNGVDMVFILDSSGSIGPQNFNTMKEFVKDVVNGFEIGPDKEKTQVGLITYSTTVRREFDLNTYSTKAEVLQAVDEVAYVDGWTYTHLALDEMTFESFTNENGARDTTEGHARVGIILTDGQSNNPPATVMAAMRAHDHDITMFAVGIGDDVDLNELEAIASEPTCLHLFLLTGFEEVESLKYQIEKGACEAPIIINPGQNGTDTEGKVPADGNQNCKVRVPAEGVTIKIEVTKGGVSYYTSEITYPSEAFHEHMVSGSEQKMAVMFIPQPPTQDEEEIVYCNLKGRNDTESDIIVGIRPGDKDWCRSEPCQNGGSCVDLGDTGYECECADGFQGQNCESEIDVCSSNPCANGECTSDGDAYQCVCEEGWTGTNCDEEIDVCSSNPCANGECTSDGDAYQCVCEEGWTGTHCDEEIDACSSNPCANGECTSDGDAYECVCEEGWTGTHCDKETDGCSSQPCENGDCVSDGDSYECVCDDGWTGAHCEEIATTPEYPTYDCDDNNPCTEENMEDGLYLFPHEDETKYVQCSEWGGCYVMDCQPGLTWDPDAATCN